MQIQKNSYESSLLNTIHKNNKLKGIKEDIFLTTWSIDRLDDFVSGGNILLDFKPGDLLNLYVKSNSSISDFPVEVYRNDAQIGYVLSFEILFNLLKAGKSLYGVIDNIDIDDLGDVEVRFKIFLKV